MKYLKYFKTEADYTAYKDGEDFVLPNVSYTEDANSVFYHVIKTEIGDYKIILLEKKNISGLTYNMIDLGLPSGLLWADRNVGASAPEDFGTYFAWGETSGYNVSTGYCTVAELCSYLQSLIGDVMTLTPDNIDEALSMMGVSEKDMTTVGFGFGKNKCFSSDWSDYFDTTDGGSIFNKYATDKLTVLQPEDDAATVNMGAEYRMPTLTDFIELKNNCTVTFIDLQGIKFTGSNGNSIFIPASKSCIDSSFGVKINNDNGAYIPSNDNMLWSSSLDDALNGTENARCIGFNHLNFLPSWNNRYLGMAVRGVCSK